MPIGTFGGLGGLIGLNPDEKSLLVYDEFTNSTNLAEWVATASGGSVAPLQAPNVDAGLYGVCRILCGSSSGNFALLRKLVGSIIAGNGGELHCQSLARLSHTPDATNDFTVETGLHNGFNASGADHGAFFKIDRTESTTNWLAVTSNGVGNQTIVDTGIEFSATDFQKLYVTINSDNTGAEFYIDGDSVASISTDMPTSDFGPSTHLITRVAGAGRNLQLAYTSTWAIYPNGRATS